ncbi:MAG: hypothetical protein ACFFG0_02495 [Candidatus Thorarchaeota archaeon]
MSEQLTNIFGDGEIAGKTPDAKSDYYLATDAQQDFHYYMEKMFDYITQLSEDSTTDFHIFSGGIVSDGGSGTIDITACFAKGYDNNNKKRFVYLPAQTGLSLPSGWNDGRQIWAILKHDFKLGTLTRTHKASGTYHYQLDDTFYGDSNGLEGATTDDLFTDSNPAGNDIILGSFTMTGTTYADQSVRSQEYSPKLRDEVYTQAQFADMIERTGANAYKFKDNVTSLKLKRLSTGYYDFTSVLSGGDTYGVLSMNNCQHFYADPGIYINVGDTASYLNMNCGHSILENIWIKGTGSIAAAIERSFLLNANYVLINNCRASNRLTNTTMTTFEESSTSSNNETVLYKNCKSYSMSDSVLSYRNGFSYNQNLEKCFDDDVLVTPQVNWDGVYQIGSNTAMTSASFYSLTTLNSTDIAYIDNTDDNLKTYRFNGDGFVQVGNSLNISGAGTKSVITALDSSNIAFIDNANSEIRKYNWDGTDWTLVGSGLSISGMGDATITALDSSNIAFIDNTNQDLRVYNWTGSTWNQTGNDLNISGIFGTRLAALNRTDIAFIDHNLTSLRLYRFDGSDWNLIGSLSNTRNTIGLCALNTTDIFLGDNTSNKIDIYRFDGSDWNLIGNSFYDSTMGGPAITLLNGSNIAFIDNANDALKVLKIGHFPK